VSRVQAEYPTSRRSETRLSYGSGERTNESVTRIERTEGPPIARTVSLTKIYHPGRVTSVKRLESPSGQLMTHIDDPHQAIVRSIIHSTRHHHEEANIVSDFNLNHNHLQSVKRTQVHTIPKI
jgi:hypothetical protein